MTLRSRILLIAAFFLSPTLLHAQDLGRHREMRLGANVLTVAGAHGLVAADAKTLHARPALLQNLEWRSLRFLGPSSPNEDPVTVITFSFYDDQLFRIVALYDQRRTEGLTDADLIEALTTAYGAPQAFPAARATKTSTPTPRSERSDEERTIARWEDAESTVSLQRDRFAASISLVVTSKRLSDLARSADEEALRLDRAEAPGREAARRQQEVDKARTDGEKARPINKAIFKP
jgi:hypothetical protein